MPQCKLVKCILTFLICASLSGCFLTKAVTVPLRLTGAAASALPVVGDVVDTTLDVTADLIDAVPL
jgi:hypothetical protein